MSSAFHFAKQVLVTLDDCGVEARLVGGCVRDRILGLEPNDFDIGVAAPPEQVIDLLGGGFKVVATGLAHGTVTVVGPDAQVEVTSLRRDVATDGRRAIVEYTTDFREDAERRDFTINAMSEDLGGRIYDYFDGRKHLKEKQLVFVGEAGLRIREDYLRILRFFRFKARFSLNSSPQYIDVISGLVSGLAKVSKERQLTELKSILCLPQVAVAVEEMARVGVWQLLLVGLRPALPEATDWRCLDQISRKNFVSRFLAIVLLVTSRNPPLDGCEQVFADMTMSKLERRQFAAGMVLVHDLASITGGQRADVLLFAERFDKGGANFLADFCSAVSCLSAVWKEPQLASAVSTLLRTEREFGHLRRTMPVDGKMLTERHPISGAEVGDLLFRLRYAYLSGEWQTQEEGLRLASKLSAS